LISWDRRWSLRDGREGNCKAFGYAGQSLISVAISMMKSMSMRDFHLEQMKYKRNETASIWECIGQNFSTQGNGALAQAIESRHLIRNISPAREKQFLLNVFIAFAADSRFLAPWSVSCSVSYWDQLNVLNSSSCSRRSARSWSISMRDPIGNSDEWFSPFRVLPRLPADITLSLSNIRVVHLFERLRNI
jgi:hypothetical protein